MHLAIDAIGAKHSGATTVARGIVTAALADERVERLTVFASPEFSEELSSLDHQARIAVVPMPFVDRRMIGRLWWAAVGLSAECRRRRCDVLLTLNPFGSSRSGPKLVVFVQQSLPFYPEAVRLHRLKSRFRIEIIAVAMKSSCRRATLNIVQTNTMKRNLVKTFGISPNKISVCSPPADLRGGWQPGSAPVILYVGNASAYKDLGTLLEGFRAARRSIPNAELILIGAGVEMLPLPDCARALGLLPTEQVLQWYSRATVLVFTSMAETVGLPLLEAMSVGVPLIVVDRDYTREICGEGALFFRARDVEDLAARIVQLLSERGLQKRLSDQSLARAACFAMESYGSVIDAIVGSGT